ncbi:MAG: hypothetical protein AAFV53_00650 [Myxococcota bacterium]
MRLKSVLTLIALVGFSFACGGLIGGGSDEVWVDEINPDETYEPGEEGPGDEVANRQAEADQFNRWEASSYSYCDAKLIGQMWDQDPGEGKLTIGYKLINGADDDLSELLVESREKAREDPERLGCSFAELDYTDDIAQKLARMWGVSESAARDMAEEKALLGDGSLLRDAVAAAEELDVAEPPGMGPTDMDTTEENVTEGNAGDGNAQPKRPVRPRRRPGDPLPRNRR